MKTDQQLADYLREVSIFAIAHGGKRCFHNWPPHTTFRYLAAHHLNGSLFVEKDAQGIKAIGVAWQDKAGDLQVREVVGDRSSARSLYDAVSRAYTGFRRVFTWRMIKDSPEFVEVPINAIKRFIQPLTLK